MVQGGIGLFVRGGVEYSGVGPGRWGRRGVEGLEKVGPGATWVG